MVIAAILQHCFNIANTPTADKVSVGPTRCCCDISKMSFLHASECDKLTMLPFGRENIMCDQGQGWVGNRAGGSKAKAEAMMMIGS